MQDAPTQPTTRWHLHRGTVQHFIVGPGPDAWLAVSAPDYASRRPTIQPDESALANAALELLEHRHAQDTAAGVAEIKQALADAAAGIKPGKPSKPKPTTINSKLATAKPLAVAIPETEVRRILTTVATITGVPVAQIESLNTQNRLIATAKQLFYGTVHSRWPNAEQRQLAQAVNRTGSTFGSTVRQHHYNVESFTDYARKFRSILEHLGLDPAIA